MEPPQRPTKRMKGKPIIPWAPRPLSEYQLYMGLCKTPKMSEFPFSRKQRSKIKKDKKYPNLQKFTPVQSAWLRYNAIHVGKLPSVVIDKRIAHRYAVPRSERIKHPEAWFKFNHNSRDWTTHVMMHSAMMLSARGAKAHTRRHPVCSTGEKDEEQDANKKPAAKPATDPTDDRKPAAKSSMKPTAAPQAEAVPKREPLSEVIRRMPRSQPRETNAGAPEPVASGEESEDLFGTDSEDESEDVHPLPSTQMPTKDTDETRRQSLPLKNN